MPLLLLRWSLCLVLGGRAALLLARLASGAGALSHVPGALAAVVGALELAGAALLLLPVARLGRPGAALLIASLALAALVHGLHGEAPQPELLIYAAAAAVLAAGPAAAPGRAA